VTDVTLARNADAAAAVLVFCQTNRKRTAVTSRPSRRPTKTKIWKVSKNKRSLVLAAVSDLRHGRQVFQNGSHGRYRAAARRPAGPRSVPQALRTRVQTQVRRSCRVFVRRTPFHARGVASRRFSSATVVPPGPGQPCPRRSPLVFYPVGRVRFAGTRVFWTIWTKSTRRRIWNCSRPRTKRSAFISTATGPFGVWNGLRAPDRST